MSWLEELSRKMAASVIEVAAEYEDAPLQLHQHAVAEAVANLETMEETIVHFESGEDLQPWTPEEERVLNESRRKLTMRAAAHLLVYWAALKREGRSGDVEQRTAIGS